MVLFGGIGAGVLLLGGILAFILISKRRKAAAEEALVAATDDEDTLNTLFGEAEPEKIRHIAPVQDVRREEIKEFAKENPEIAAQMIKSWLRSED